MVYLQNVKKQNYQKKKKARFILWKSGLLFLLSIVLMASFVLEYGLTVSADNGEITNEDTQTIDLRLVFTTDIHGQLDGTDYEKNKPFASGSLAKAYTLIQEAKSEVLPDNTLTFDVGDILFDYSTEFIFSEDKNEVQPIYKAMKLIGYDAITLGNHDFDYGFDYIVNQLERSGMMEKCVVSNVTAAKTGDYPFNRNAVIYRNVESRQGSHVLLKIGVIGETVPKLSTKTENYTNILKTEDIVQNVTKEAKAMKEDGCDLVVVLAHSGFGEEEPELNTENAAYALTKIDEVDVILSGHEHKQFPNEDKSMAYYQLPGVDSQTSLVNGKNLVMAGTQGTGIGGVDLTIEVNGQESVITDRNSWIRKVNAYTTYADPSFQDMYGQWDERMLEFANEELATIEEGKKYQNFYGLMEDNAGIQLLNDAKRAYALEYVNTKGKKYKDYPIIAASRYSSYGVNGVDDYVNVSGTIKGSDMSKMQLFHAYLAIYTISGQQLREWLEWSASAYETIGSNLPWSNPIINTVKDASGLSPLLSEEWMTNWSPFRIFDGVEYVIDPTREPRYDVNGNQISESSRIVSLTYNGKTVTDNQQFLLATDGITTTGQPNAPVVKQKVLGGYIKSQTYVYSYLKDFGAANILSPYVDNNWRIQMPNGYRFFIEASNEAEELTMQQSWYRKTIANLFPNSYYEAELIPNTLDTIGPSVVAVPAVKIPTNNPIVVGVDATDPSGLNWIKYKKGDISSKADGWDSGITIENNAFQVKENGIYTICAEDKKGNRTTVKIKIDNIDPSILQAPDVNTYSNRMANITGTAEPKADIYFVTDSETYESKVKEDGTFSYALPNQKADSMVKVYVKDWKNRKSAETIVEVKRTGPNRPSLSYIQNTTNKVKGNLNDTNVDVFAVVDNKVYVAENGGADAYMSSTLYNANKTIVESTYSVTSKGVFSLTMTQLTPDTKVQVYTVDHLGRVSRQRSTYVRENGPNSPIMNYVCDLDNTITGSITKLKSDPNASYNYVLTIEGKEYKGTTNEDGTFAVPVEPLIAGSAVKMYVIDQKEGSERKSYVRSMEVRDYREYTQTEELILNPITNKDTVISGMYKANAKVTLIIDNERIEVICNSAGSFSTMLENTLSSETKVYAYARSSTKPVAAKMVIVSATPPETPILVDDGIYTDTSYVQIWDTDLCTIVLKMGDRTYSTNSGIYDSVNNRYTYALEIEPQELNTEFELYAENSAGTSKIVSGFVIQREEYETGETDETPPSEGELEQ